MVPRSYAKKWQSSTLIALCQGILLSPKFQVVEMVVAGVA